MFQFSERIYKDRRENISHGILYPKCHNCEDFLDFSRLRFPLDLWTVKKRIEWNLKIYRGNYMWAIFILAVFTSRGIRQFGMLFCLCLLWIILCVTAAMISSYLRFTYRHDIPAIKMVSET